MHPVHMVWTNLNSNFLNIARLTHWGQDEIDTILQTTFSNAIYLNENVRIPIKISLEFVPNGPVNNIPALVQIMAWRRPGDKPLSEPMMVCSSKHICVTRLQWVNNGDVQQESFECLPLLMDSMDKRFPLSCWWIYGNFIQGFSIWTLVFYSFWKKYIVCDVCRLRSATFESTDVLYINPKHNTPMQELVMQDHKQNLYKTCSHCKKDTWYVESKHLLQLPTYCIITVNRCNYINTIATKQESYS